MKMALWVVMWSLALLAPGRSALASDSVRYSVECACQAGDKGECLDAGNTASSDPDKRYHSFETSSDDPQKLQELGDGRCGIILNAACRQPCVRKMTSHSPLDQPSEGGGAEGSDTVVSRKTLRRDPYQGSPPPATTVTERCSPFEGNPNPALEDLQPNQTYAIESTNWRFTTDEQARLVRVDATLSLEALEQREDDLQRCARHPTSQRRVGHACEAGECDGGHLIGHQFGGPGEQVNMVPMERKSNRWRAWRTLEKEWELQFYDEEVFTVAILIEYSGSSNVPTHFRGFWEESSPAGVIYTPIDVANTL